MMTRTTIARLAGFMFLFYIVAGIIGMVLFNQASGGETAAARLASIAEHRPLAGLSFVVAVIGIFNALVLGWALYVLTRDEDPDLALLALLCRVVEGAINAIPAIAILALLSMASGAPRLPDDSAQTALSAFLFSVQEWSVTVGATVFAAGSLLYAWLFLRARSIPVWLAWLGLLASPQLIVTVPLAGLGVLTGAAVGIMWLPMLIFEVGLGLLLLTKGTAALSRPRLAAAQAAVL